MAEKDAGSRGAEDEPRDPRPEPETGPAGSSVPTATSGSAEPAAPGQSAGSTETEPAASAAPAGSASSSGSVEQNAPTTPLPARPTFVSPWASPAGTPGGVGPGSPSAGQGSMPGNIGPSSPWTGPGGAAGSVGPGSPWAGPGGAAGGMGSGSPSAGMPGGVGPGSPWTGPGQSPGATGPYAAWSGQTGPGQPGSGPANAKQPGSWGAFGPGGAGWNAPGWQDPHARFAPPPRPSLSARLAARLPRGQTGRLVVVGVACALAGALLGGSVVAVTGLVWNRVDSRLSWDSGRDRPRLFPRGYGQDVPQSPEDFLPPWCRRTDSGVRC